MLLAFAAVSAKGPGRCTRVWERCQFLTWVQRTQPRSRAVPEALKQVPGQDGITAHQCYPLAGWKHALFFPLSCCGGACLRNGRSTAAWFPRDALIGPCWWYKPRWGFLCSKATPSSSSPCESLVACPGWGCSCFPLSSGRTLAVFTLF